MLRASITFFILAIVSMLLGMNGIAGLSIEIGKILLFVFLILAVISFFVGRKGRGSKLAITLMALMAGNVYFSHMAHADDSVKDTAKEVANDTKRGANKAVRAVKDKTCALVNGKTECALQKTKHAIQNGADNVEDAID